mmetsp:Transcript_74215/g.188342  ORF Transcript_74215/g.188342 Transcript_74215/m.188342 type:complete len:227 (+) Transcript_74215:296-976(+)
MSLNCPGIRTSITSLKLPPMPANSSGVNQPRSPHIAPPFFALSHSDDFLHNSWNFLEVAVTISVASFGGFLRDFTSCFNSKRALLKMVSASCRLLSGFLPSFGGPSANLTKRWRSRMLCVVPPRAFVTLAFFTGCCGRSSGPEEPGARRLWSSSIGGRKQTLTAVHCAEPAFATRALVAISPQAARGCLRYSPPMSTSSLMFSVEATVDVAKIKNGFWSDDPSTTE